MKKVKPIKGKHLNQALKVDAKTGKETKHDGSMFLMPAKEGTCPDCATIHELDWPHNAQSMFYQYKFYNEYGRWPNWGDAMKHCDPKTKKFWKLELMKHGVKESDFKVKAVKK